MTLAAIVVIYLTCNTPRLLLNCMEYHYLSVIMDMDFCHCSKHINWFELLLLINHLFLVINSSANILLYASVCNTFKTRLLLRLKLGRQQSCNSDIEERNHLESLSFPIQKTNVANIDLVEICEK